MVVCGNVTSLHFATLLLATGSEISPVPLPPTADCVFKLPMRDLVLPNGAIATLKSLVS